MAELNDNTRFKPIHSLEGYSDTVSARRIKDKVTLDTKFHFEDNDAAGVGDYYNVRVQQIDGAIAWSSPVWIGGAQKQ